MKLTQAELAYFETFGYLCLPGCLSNEIEEITRRFEKIWDAHGGGHFGQEHDGKQRSALLPFIDIDEYLSSLIDHPRLDGIASSILGDDYNYTSSDGNFYVGDTGWHSDGYGLSKYTSIKMAMYLDPVGSESGCLRVIPGSHHVGDSFGDVLNKAVPSSKKANYEEIWGVTGRDIPSVHLNSKPGDLVVFNHSLKHASFGGGDKRRMFTINYQKRHDDKDIDDLKEDIGRMARFWPERAYGEVMINTATSARMRHLEQRLSNDSHLIDLVNKAKKEMKEPSTG